ncbi:MAG: lipoprotein [Pseudomonadota bacterium]
MVNSEKGNCRMVIRIRTLAVVCLCLSTTLAACGRKGDLDAPGTPVEQQNTLSEPVDPATAPPPPELEPETDDRTFFLDFLIN